eukprot:comp24074_c0_seq1/m.43324 comp24074_c0_seq1/g.43324  ORF comp24074_c0_seq1/g.43324 comp24074_c0_seq1/m.43324 type:complete len:387 (-) comp24074_c0_seq1:596-1756(-)
MALRGTGLANARGLRSVFSGSMTRLAPALSVTAARHLTTATDTPAPLKPVKVAVFDCKFLRERLLAGKGPEHQLTFFEVELNDETAGLAEGFDAVSLFVNGRVDEKGIDKLHQQRVDLIALRCAGFNHVDVRAAYKRGMSVCNVPAYSPYSVAEFAVALLMACNRRLITASNRIRHGNFQLQGLVGFDMHGKTIGVLGTGKIGAAFVNIMLGFGCRVLATDPYPNPSLKERPGVTYVDLHTMLESSDVISLFAPSTPENHHIINRYTIGRMKKGVILINCARGGLVKTPDLIDALKDKYVAAAGLDVIEEEGGLFYNDHSLEIIKSDAVARLLTLPNCILTSHMSFMTAEALGNISSTTLGNLTEYAQGKRGFDLTNHVRIPTTPA